jgi:hypothetical protein
MGQQERIKYQFSYGEWKRDEFDLIWLRCDIFKTYKKTGDGWQRHPAQQSSRPMVIKKW